jgi:hypothetical protein
MTNLRNGDFFSEHRLDNLGTPGNINKFNVEAVLVEQSRILRHPENGHRAHGCRIRDFELGLSCCATAPNDYQSSDYPNPSQRYLNFSPRISDQAHRKNRDSRKGAKGAKFRRNKYWSFFECLASCRDKLFYHFNSEHKMLGINSQTSECKKSNLHLMNSKPETRNCLFTDAQIRGTNPSVSPARLLPLALEPILRYRRLRIATRGPRCCRSN